MFQSCECEFCSDSVALSAKRPANVVERLLSPQVRRCNLRLFSSDPLNQGTVFRMTFEVAIELVVRRLPESFVQIDVPPVHGPTIT